jgi:hypothetical protein
MTPIASAGTGRIGATGGATRDVDPAPACRRVCALSVDAALLRRLPVTPQRVRVHSVFEHVVNLDAGDGTLLTLAHRGADDAPDSIVVDLHSWSGLGLAPGTVAQLSDRRIDLGERMVVALAGARPWQGRLPAYAQDESRLRANLPLAQFFLDWRSKGIGVRTSADGDPGAFDRALATAFRGAAAGLCRALTHGDERTAHQHIGCLVGLGPGLTPSGDDFLLGLLAALNVPGSPRQALRRIGTFVIECAESHTHLISAAALRHAARGRVRGRVIGLCDALMRAPSTSMLPALDDVMRIGSTSGSEMASGVFAGFRLHLDRQARPSPQPHGASWESTDEQ